MQGEGGVGVTVRTAKNLPLARATLIVPKRTGALGRAGDAVLADRAVCRGIMTNHRE